MTSVRLVNVAALAVALLAAGCDSAERTSLPTEFVSDGPIEAGTISLRSEDGLSFQLVAKDIDSIYGVAFRLRFDPAVLRFVELSASDAWPDASVAIAEVVRPGELAGVIGARGRFEGLPSGEVSLGTLSLARAGVGASPLAFEAARSGVIADDGHRSSDVKFVGGTVR